VTAVDKKRCVLQPLIPEEEQMYFDFMINMCGKIFDVTLC